MLTSGIDNGTTTVSSSQTTTRGFDDMASEDFFKLLITELQSQDPMNPTDNQALMEQVSTIRTMEQTTALNETLQALASEQRFGATSSMIGQYVAGTVKDKSGNEYELQGLVIGVRFDEGGNAILELHNGKSLPAANVEQVTVVENLPADILAQLEADLGRDLTPETDGEDDDEGGDDGSDDGSGDGGTEGDESTARAIVAQKAALKSSVATARTNAGDSARYAAQRGDTASSLLDSILRPRKGLGL